MKQRLVKIFVLITVMVLAFSLAGCGKSAYQVALENGFTGSETEWLESLKGKDAPAITIYDLYEAYKQNVDADATFAEFLASYNVVESPDEDLKEASATALRSAVSIVSTFTRRTETVSAAGSGFIYKLDKSTGEAYIITNYHVIYDLQSTGANGISQNIKMFLYGKVYSAYTISAEFVGGSMENDVAVLRARSDYFKEDFYQPVTLADSNDIIIGENVIVVGNPENEGISVTTGTLCVDSEVIQMKALDYTAQNQKIITPRVVRVDAAINGGNSGGGVYNINGELIALVNAKMADAEIDNIGYAIPSNVVVGLVENLLDNGTSKAKVAKMGITTQIQNTRAVYDETTKTTKIIEEVSVYAVSSGTPAYKNLKKGDIITAIKINDGQPQTITRSFHIDDTMLKVRQGDTVTVSIIREGTPGEITLNFNSSAYFKTVS